MAEHHETHTAQTQEHPASHSGESKASLLEIDGTIIFIALSFIVFTVVMQKIFYGPLTEIRERRKHYIEKLKKEAGEAKENAEKISSEYNQKIQSARKKSSENTAEVMAEANQEKAKILEEKKQQVSEFLLECRKKIREQKAKSLGNLKQQIDSYADQIFKKVLEEDITVTIGERNE